MVAMIIVEAGNNNDSNNIKWLFVVVLYGVLFLGVSWRHRCGWAVFIRL